MHHKFTFIWYIMAAVSLLIPITSVLSFMQIKRFAQRYEVHVWLVAHPRQLMDWQGKAPTLYDISGSAHFINKADCGVVVHRSWEGPMDDKKVKIMVGGFYRMEVFLP